MATAFGQGVLKLSLLGQKQSEVRNASHTPPFPQSRADTGSAHQLTDCSEVIPAVIPFTGGPATLPPGLTMNDIEQAVRIYPFYKLRCAAEASRIQCATAAFPSLATQPGPPTTVPSMYVSSNLLP